MKSKAVALGHPIHPMLIPFPFAFLIGAALFDAPGGCATSRRGGRQEVSWVWPESRPRSSRRFPA
jgi:uncharacterized membrane protein